MPPQDPDPSTLTYPRILCLHGGGVTAEVFALQMRAVKRSLQSSGFRLVFVDGPFLCEAGPGILPVYEGFGPYRRWLHWKSSHTGPDDDTTISEIEDALLGAVDADDALGATGPWVGVLGFSQGAKVAASLLYDKQQRIRDGEWEENGGARASKGAGGWWRGWKFGVIMAGRPPLVSLSEATRGDDERLMRAGGVTEKWDGFVGWRPLDDPLQIPTIHLLGRQDPGFQLHKKLPHYYCDPESVTVLEWDGDHRIPFKSADVEMLVGAVVRVADRVGVVRVPEEEGGR